MRIEPLAAPFGATVTAVSIAELDDATWTELRAAWAEHALLILPGQFPTRDEQNDFARRFGGLEFEAAPISNLDKDGNVRAASDDDVVKSLRGNEGWHHDSTYMPVQAKGAVFSAEIIPVSGGAATGFADMRAAYDALDDITRERVSSMSAYHSLYYSQGRANYLPTQNDAGGYDLYGYHDLETPRRPLVKVHPETGRPNLVIGRHAHDIVGMAQEDSEAFLDEINDWACQDQRTYHHEWTVGDMVVWDNRRLMHRATPYDMTEPRRMWHTRIAGDPATETAPNHR